MLEQCGAEHMVGAPGESCCACVSCSSPSQLQPLPAVLGWQLSWIQTVELANSLWDL